MLHLKQIWKHFDSMTKYCTWWQSQRAHRAWDEICSNQLEKWLFWFPFISYQSPHSLQHQHAITSLFCVRAWSWNEFEKLSRCVACQLHAEHHHGVTYPKPRWPNSWLLAMYMPLDHPTKFQPDWSSHLWVYKDQTTGIILTTQASLAQLGLIVYKKKY